MMQLTTKLAGLALALALLGACASPPEPIALGERSFRVQALEQARPPHRPDMKQGARQALRQAALVAQRNDADHLRVLDIRITESAKQAPGTRHRPMIHGAGLIGALVGELVFAAVDAARPPPPTVTVIVRQLELDFEITAEDQPPTDTGDYLGVKPVLEMTAPFAKDEEPAGDELPPRVRTLLDSALLNVTRAEPAAETSAEPTPNDLQTPAWTPNDLVIPDRRPDGTVIEAPASDTPASEATSN